MAKKGKDEVPNPNSVANRDILQRMNFLYQASAFLNNLVDPDPVPPPSTSKAPEVSALYSGGIAPAAVADSRSNVSKPPLSRKKLQLRERRKKRHPATYADLSKTYVQSMKTISQKTNVKLDPAVKRTLCKKCNIVLLAGVTATVRVKTSSTHGHIICYTCTSCNTLRRIPAPPTLHPQPQDAEGAAHALATSEGGDADAMAIDTITSGGKAPGSRRKKRKARIARIPPLFERDVGHVVFKGNEQLANKDASRFMCS